jgi:hypothetical protein
MSLAAGAPEKMQLIEYVLPSNELKDSCHYTGLSLPARRARRKVRLCAEARYAQWLWFNVHFFPCFK